MKKIAIRDIPEDGLMISGVQTDLPQFGEMLKTLTGLESDKSFIDYNIHINKFNKEILINGELCFSYPQICSRCAEEFNFSNKENFKLILNLYKISDEDKKNVVDLTTNDLDKSFLDGEFIDITEIIKEQLTLSLPISPLCSEQCKGRCTVCGSNLNFSKCQCHRIKKRNINPKFAILRNFKIKR